METTVKSCAAAGSAAALRRPGSFQRGAFLLRSTVILLTHGQQAVPWWPRGSSPSLPFVFFTQPCSVLKGAKEAEHLL